MDCKLRGSSFSNSQLSNCNSEASDWTGVDFSSAYFNGCHLSGIKNAHKAKGLHTAHGDGFIALVLFPIYFYILDVYNRHVQAWKAALAKHAAAEGFATIGREALDKFGGLPIPALSLEALFSAILLFVASFLYDLTCPGRVKQLSSEQWRYEVKKPMVTYLPLAWRHLAVRMICAACYLVGGLLRSLSCVHLISSFLHSLRFGMAK